MTSFLIAATVDDNSKNFIIFITISRLFKINFNQSVRMESQQIVSWFSFYPFLKKKYYQSQTNLLSACTELVHKMAISKNELPNANLTSNLIFQDQNKSCLCV